MKPSLHLLASLFALFLASLACQGSFSTANLADAWMSTDLEGNHRTTLFAQDAIFYAQADLQNAPDDTVTKAAWYAVNAEGIDPNFLINETELTSGSSILRFELSNDNLWPLGSYKVDLYLNGEYARTVTFEVR